MSYAVQRARRIARGENLAPAPAREEAPVRSGKNEPVERADGSICISETQKKIHVASEAAAVFLAAPFTAWLALNPKNGLEKWERAGLGVLTVGTLVIDGGLLIRWARRRKQ